MSGCGVFQRPNTEDTDDPFTHRAYTTAHPLPSADGTALAFALEPHRVDADEHGVMVDGWRGQVAGDTVVRVVAGPRRGDVLTTIPRGFVRGDGVASTLFVFGSDAATWTPVAPNDPPPSAPPMSSVTWFDRDSLTVRGTRRFDPPLEYPIALGAPLVVDTPPPGESDVARDVAIATYDLRDGARRSLHQARGYSVATCARASAVTVAYQPEDAATKTVVLDVSYDERTDAVAVLRLDVEDLKSRNVLCRAAGRHAAIVGARPSNAEPRTVVVQRAEEVLSVAKDVDAWGVALSVDGRSLVTELPSGGVALVNDAGLQPLTGVRTGSTPVVVSDDRALFVEAADAWLVRLDGSVPSVRAIAATSAGAEAGATGGVERVAFAVRGGGFFVFDGTSDEMLRAFLLEPDGVASDVAVDRGYTRPYVEYADEHRAYLTVERRAGASFDAPVDVELLTVDTSAHAVTDTGSALLCDPDTIRHANRCMP